MEMMEFRHAELQRTLDGLNQTQTPLVAKCDGWYQAAGFTDDQGLYYFVPSIAKYLGLSIDRAIDIFFGSLWFIGAVIAIWSFLVIFKHWSSRFTSVAGVLMLTYVATHYRDVYAIFFFAVTATVPLFLVLSYKQCGLNLFTFLAIAFSSLIAGYCNFIRCYSGVGVLLFLILWIFLNERLDLKNKILSCLVLFVFVSIPYLHFNSVEARRDAFLKTAQSTYQTISIAHPIWHIVYMGLGYLPNKYGIEFSDSSAGNAALAIDPTVVYCSNEYSQILKDKCLLIAKNDPLFVIKTLLAKIGVLCLKILIFTNFGLLMCFYVRSRAASIIPFAAAILFYATPGILAIPRNCYVFGMICMAAIFGVYMISLGTEKHFKTSLQGAFA